MYRCKYIRIYVCVLRLCLVPVWQLVRKTRTNGCRGSNGVLAFTKQDARHYGLSAASPTLAWSSLLRQLIFKYDVRSDTARKHITRKKPCRTERPNVNPKINSPYGLPFGALISHACSSKRCRWRPYSFLISSLIPTLYLTLSLGENIRFHCYPLELLD